jgi:DNA-binding transcriptional ArsR family regulator
MRFLPHPQRDQLDLALVLDALSDPTRLAIVAQLSAEKDERRCGTFLDLGSKSNLTYHFTKLRSAGVVRIRIDGTARYMSLRRADLDARFPGLLDTILAAARRQAGKTATPKPAPRRERRAAAR